MTYQKETSGPKRHDYIGAANVKNLRWLACSLTSAPFGDSSIVCARDFLEQSIRDSNESRCWSSTLVEMAKTGLSKCGGRPKPAQGRYIYIYVYIYIQYIL